MRRAALALALGLGVVTPAHALSLAHTHLVLDWPDLAFTTTGTLTATQIVEAHPPSVRSVTEGTASVTGLTLDAQAAAAGAHATATLVADRTFWFYGIGAGTLDVDIPFTLDIMDTSDVAHGSAEVDLFVGPGVIPGGDAGQTFEFVGAGTLHREGVLHVSRDLVSPTWGPLVDVGLFAEAQARVPEPATALLLELGLLGLVAWVAGRRDG